MSDICIPETLTPAVCSRKLEDGINKQEYTSVVKTITGMAEKEFAVIAGVSRRTLSRLKPTQNVPPLTAEVMLSVLRIYQKACEIFGSEQRALTWIRRPNSEPGGKTPVQALKTRYRAKEVLDILTRIEYGIYA